MSVPSVQGLPRKTKVIFLRSERCCESFLGRDVRPDIHPDVRRISRRKTLCLGCLSLPKNRALARAWSTSAPNRFCVKRQLETIWRVAGRESGSPELLESPWTSQIRSSPNKFLGDCPRTPLTVNFKRNPEVPRKFPRLPRKFLHTSPEVP